MIRSKAQYRTKVSPVLSPPAIRNRMIAIKFGRTLFVTVFRKFNEFVVVTDILVGIVLF